MGQEWRHFSCPVDWTMLSTHRNIFCRSAIPSITNINDCLHMSVQRFYVSGSVRTEKLFAHLELYHGLCRMWAGLGSKQVFVQSLHGLYMSKGTLIFLGPLWHREPSSPRLWHCNKCVKIRDTACHYSPFICVCGMCSECVIRNIVRHWLSINTGS